MCKNAQQGQPGHINERTDRWMQPIALCLKGSAYKNDVMMTDLPKKIILFCVVQFKGVSDTEQIWVVRLRSNT